METLSSQLRISNHHQEKDLSDEIGFRLIVSPLEKHH
jgi:hypothetical protein